MKVITTGFVNNMTIYKDNIEEVKENSEVRYELTFTVKSILRFFFGPLHQHCPWPGLTFA